MIGEKIKSLIKTSGMSISEVARRIGTTYPNLNKILKKESVDTKYLVKIGEVLNISMNSFFLEESITERNNHILVLSHARKEIDRTIQLLSLIQTILKDKKCNSVVEEKFKILVTNIKNIFIANDLEMDGLKKINYDNTMLENIINIIDDLKDTRKLIDENIDEKYKVKP